MCWCTFYPNHASKLDNPTIHIKVGDTLKNSVGLPLTIKSIADEVLTCVNYCGEKFNYRIDWVLKKLRDGDWEHIKAKKYANWI